MEKTDPIWKENANGGQQQQPNKNTHTQFRTHSTHKLNNAFSNCDHNDDCLNTVFIFTHGLMLLYGPTNCCCWLLPLEYLAEQIQINIS